MTSISIGNRVHGGLNKLLVPIENLAAAVSGVVTMIAMALTTIDALSRYFLNSPLVFQFYLTANYLLISLIMLALPWGFRTGGYIRVSVLTEHLPPKIRLPLFRVGLIASAGYLLLLAYKAGQYTFDAFAKNLMYIEDLNWPVGWSWVWVPIGCGLLALRVLLIALGPDSDLHIEHDPEEEI